MADPNLVLVGCGNMGVALLRGWLHRGIAADAIQVVEPGEPQATRARDLGVRVVESADALDPGRAPDAIVLAVKPQVMEAAASAYAGHAGRAVFLSIAAGRTIASFEKLFGAAAAIVRTMPNTPGAIGRGITVACPNAAVTDAHRILCDGLLQAMGEVAWLEDEALMDAVTAVSGSGPAYVFLLAESMRDAGIAAGLPEDLADRLARHTVAGAGALILESGEDPARLREQVTSPGGTTAAALEVLRSEGAMPDLLRDAIAASARRSRELAG
ncbi:pyrroline-5-carboxylate reductase [Marinibaculum pumilum]|uniref:Pyrroline-5-carboxylate reductase n=1 Tax=Marinibaculum pumilum TaxID=1766165 RepID=A0ABV7L4N3_9PROT